MLIFIPTQNYNYYVMIEDQMTFVYKGALLSR